MQRKCRLWKHVIEMVPFPWTHRSAFVPLPGVGLPGFGRTTGSEIRSRGVGYLACLMVHFANGNGLAGRRGHLPHGGWRVAPPPLIRESSGGSRVVVGSYHLGRP